MGDTGPCGPCTEIHIDIREEEERKKIPGEQLVNRDHPGAAVAYPVDIADHAAVQELGKRVAAELGGVNVLVNNAGITATGC